MRLALALLLLLLTGCAAPTAMGPAYTPPARSHTWIKTEELKTMMVAKIETDLAMDFCTAMLGTHAVACAVRFATGRCVLIIQPNAGEQAAHEAGHCMGFDHR